MATRYDNDDHDDDDDNYDGDGDKTGLLLLLMMMTDRLARSFVCGVPIAIRALRRSIIGQPQARGAEGMLA